jgi:hypothetical protein
MICRNIENKKPLLYMLLFFGIILLFIWYYTSLKIGYKNSIIILCISIFTIFLSLLLLYFVNRINSNNTIHTINLTEDLIRTSVFIIREIKYINQDNNIQEDEENGLNNQQNSIKIIPIATEIPIK